MNQTHPFYVIRYNDKRFNSPTEETLLQQHHHRSHTAFMIQLIVCSGAQKQMIKNSHYWPTLWWSCWTSSFTTQWASNTEHVVMGYSHHDNLCPWLVPINRRPACFSPDYTDNTPKHYIRMGHSQQNHMLVVAKNNIYQSLSKSIYENKYVINHTFHQCNASSLIS